MKKHADKGLDVRGDLQIGVMAAVWQLGEATVEDVRSAQSRPRRSAYNTVQTVMNRLVERGLLARRRRGNAYVYTAKYDEATYLARTIGDRLAEASPEARRAALVHLVEGLDPSEQDEVARYTRRIKRRREGGG
jgi:predicted transcriptional regulator